MKKDNFGQRCRYFHTNVFEGPSENSNIITNHYLFEPWEYSSVSLDLNLWKQWKKAYAFCSLSWENQWIHLFSPRTYLFAPWVIEELYVARMQRLSCVHGHQNNFIANNNLGIREKSPMRQCLAFWSISEAKNSSMKVLLVDLTPGLFILQTNFRSILVLFQVKLLWEMIR